MARKKVPGAAYLPAGSGAINASNGTTAVPTTSDAQAARLLGRAQDTARKVQNPRTSAAAGGAAALIEGKQVSGGARITGGRG